MNWNFKLRHRNLLHLTPLVPGGIIASPCIEETPMQSVRNPSKLSEPILQQLNSYALAAGAVGAGLLAVSQPLRAEVVFTPTHVRLANGQVPIDLNNDGTPDFFLINQSHGKSCCFYSRTLSVAGGYVGSSQNGVIGLALWANALKAGQAIGPPQQRVPAH